MRFRNLSSIPIPKNLWHAAASHLRVGDQLPQAIIDEFRLYGSKKRLRVTVRPESVNPTKDSEAGTYVFGHIELFPCKRCTIGYLTKVYFHELVHAWLDQYHNAIYVSHESCRVAERFANAAYRAIGGSYGPKHLCGGFDLDPIAALARMSVFADLSGSLVGRKPTRVFDWKPPNRLRNELSGT